MDRRPPPVPYSKTPNLHIFSSRRMQKGLSSAGGARAQRHESPNKLSAPPGEAEHHQIYASTNVRNTLDTAADTKALRLRDGRKKTKPMADPLRSTKLAAQKPPQVVSRNHFL